MALLIKSWLRKHKTTKQDLLSLIGKLLSKVVPSGHLFLHQLIELSTTVFKLHHHIHLNVEAKEDIIWWNKFLPSWNGVSIFLDPNWKDAEAWLWSIFQWGMVPWCLAALSEASHALNSVAGVVCHRCSSLHMGTPQCITVHCDYMAIVQAWSNQSARHPGILHLLRTLFFITAKHGFISAWFICKAN